MDNNVLIVINIDSGLDEQSSIVVKSEKFTVIVAFKI
jgi:hypothetical protein